VQYLDYPTSALIILGAVVLPMPATFPVSLDIKKNQANTYKGLHTGIIYSAYRVAHSGYWCVIVLPKIPVRL